MNGRLIGRILIGIVIVAVLAGLGFAVYSAGFAQGVAQAGGFAEGTFRWMPGMRGMMDGFRPYGWFGGFGLFGLLGFLFQLFLLFGLIWLAGRLFFGWRRGPWGGPGGWKGDGVPPMFEEWHRRAHGRTPEAPSQDRPASQ